MLLLTNEEEARQRLVESPLAKLKLKKLKDETKELKEDTKNANNET